MFITLAYYILLILYNRGNIICFYQRSDSCFYNPIHVKFNEEFTTGIRFLYTTISFLLYLKKYLFNINQNVLNNINSTISTDVLTFKNGLVERKNR